MGSVEVRDGNFIGRDYVAVLNMVVHQGEDARGAQLALASYLRALATDLAGLRLGEIDASTDQTRQTPLELPDIYVPLNTSFRVPKKLSLQSALSVDNPGNRLLTGGRKEQPTEMRSVSALEALATHQRLTLLGPAGGGKSSFGAHVLLALAQAWRGHGQPLQQQLGKTWHHRGLLPIRVVLRRFAERHGQQPQLTAGQLWAFIGQDMEDAGWGDARQAMTYVQRLARQQGALLLFDGLDECGDETTRASVLGAVEQLMSAEAGKSRFLLTARPYAFPAGSNPAGRRRAGLRAHPSQPGVHHRHAPDRSRPHSASHWRRSV